MQYFKTILLRTLVTNLMEQQMAENKFSLDVLLPANASPQHWDLLAGLRQYN